MLFRHIVGDQDVDPVTVYPLPSRARAYLGLYVESQFELSGFVSTTLFVPERYQQWSQILITGEDQVAKSLRANTYDHV